MKKRHIEIEKGFYNDAYKNPITRKDRGFGWDKKESPSMVKLFEKHVQCTQTEREIRVLDIGIGDGRNAIYFLRQGYHAMGIDFCETAIDYCNKSLSNYRPHLNLLLADMTKLKRSEFEKLGQFNLVIDWSVMDHIRRQYLPRYKSTILELIRPGGFLISTQFAWPMPERFKTFKRKDYHLWNGHYMRAFSLEGLQSEFPSLKVIDFFANCREDKINGIKLHTILFQK